MSKHIEEAIVELYKFVNTWAGGAPYDTDPTKIPMHQALDMLADVMDVLGIEMKIVERKHDD